MSEIDSGAVAPDSEVESAEIETQQQSSTVDETPTSTETVEQTASTDDEASGEDSAETEKTKQKKRNSFQERINTKTRQAREAEQRAVDAERRAAAAEQQIAQQQNQITPGNFPQLEDYDYDQAAYQQAVIEHTSEMNRQNIRNARAEEERLSATQAKQTAQRAVVETFQERSNAFAAEHSDYRESVTNPSVPIAGAVLQAIVTADNGPAIAYHLSKNADLAIEISHLPPPQQMMRVGMLSAQLNTPVAKQTTNAPPPPTKSVGSGKTKPTKDPDKMTPDEYRRHRGYA